MVGCVRSTNVQREAPLPCARLWREAFNKRVEGFEPLADLLAPAVHGMLYQRGSGRLQSALDLPEAAQAPAAAGTKM